MIEIKSREFSGPEMFVYWNFMTDGQSHTPSPPAGSVESVFSSGPFTRSIRPQQQTEQTNKPGRQESESSTDHER
jgi:hypothetical protein